MDEISIEASDVLQGILTGFMVTDFYYTKEIHSSLDFMQRCEHCTRRFNTNNGHQLVRILTEHSFWFVSKFFPSYDDTLFQIDDYEALYRILPDKFDALKGATDNITFAWTNSLEARCRDFENLLPLSN